MKLKGTIHATSNIRAADHKNARTSHQGNEKSCKKKMTFFGDRTSRQFARNEMIQDGLELMQIQNEMEEARIAREEESRQWTI